MSELFHSVKSMMDLERVYDPKYSREWSESSMEIFIADDDSFIRSLTSTAANILISFPYDETGVAALNARVSPDILREMRFYRKVLMIGRDALNLTNSTDLIDKPETRPISTLTTTLGKIADKDGRGKSRRIDAFSQAIDAALASQYIDNDFVNPVSYEALRYRYQHALQTDLLMNDTSTLVDIDEEVYHVARRDFRSIVHLGVVSQLIEPSDLKLEYVKQGIELSRVYGENHDQIVAHQKQNG